MPGSFTPPICFHGFIPVASGIYLRLERTLTDVPPHIRGVQPITGLVQAHMHQDALGAESVRAALRLQGPSVVARLSVSLSPEFSTIISREAALSAADHFGVYLDLPERADLVDPADDRFLPITTERSVTSSVSATGVRVIPQRHLLADLTAAVDGQAASGYEPMRGQLRLAADNVEIGAPRSVAVALPPWAADPPSALGAPVAVKTYAELMSHLDGLAKWQQAKVTAIASDRTYEMSVRMHPWGLEASAPLPRRPDSLSVSLPDPALSERELSWLDDVALTIKGTLGGQRVSPDDNGFKELDSYIEGLREEVADARKARDLPNRPVTDVIFEADHETLQKWQQEGESAARSFEKKASDTADPERRAAYLLRSVLHRDFWVEIQALNAAMQGTGSSRSSVEQDIHPAEAGHGESIPLTRMPPTPSTPAARHQFIPMVRTILEPSAAQVTEEHMATLTAYTKEAYEKRTEGEIVGLDALRRRHGYATLKQDLEETRKRTGVQGSIERKVARYIKGAKPEATDDRRHELLRLALRLLDKVPNLSGADYEKAIRDSDVFLDWAQLRYSKTHLDNRPPGPLPLDVLAELIRGKLDGDVSLNLRNVGRIAEERNARRTWWEEKPLLPKRLISRTGSLPGVGKVTQSVSTTHTKRITGKLENGDRDQDRNREVKALRALLEAASPPVSVPDEDLKRLVATRRRLYAKSWDRRYTALGVFHYQQMARELLGRDGVTADVLRDLAVLTRPESSLRVGGVDQPFNHRQIRQDLTNNALKEWRPGTDKPGPRPEVGGGGRDYSRMVTAFHTIELGPFVSDLTAWINQSVPFSGNQITEDVVARKITSLFGQTLDDGTPLEIAVDGRIYDIRLWAIPIREPEVEPESLPGKSGLFPGALEGRTYGFSESANSEAQTRSIFGDIGPAHRYLLGVRSDTTLTYGQSSGSGKRALSSTTKAKYQQVRIKENMGWVTLDVNWALRVQERRTYHRKRDAVSEFAGVPAVVNKVREGTLTTDEEGGRWIQRVFTDSMGTPVMNKIRYAVPEFHLPYSKEQSESDELKAKTDADYGKVIPISDPSDFEVWSMDHAVTRIQLADRVIASVRKILTPADYAFWKTHLERYLSNDELALNFQNLMRPKGDRGYQQTFRVLLESNGRRLSLSLGAKDNKPITSLTKISQVSRSGETRIDRVRASVLRTQVTQDNDSTHRVTANEFARLWSSRVARLGGRIQKPFGNKVGQFSQQRRTFTTRATRIVDNLQVASIDFDLELRIHHHRDKDLMAGRREHVDYENHENLSGFAHVLVHEDDLKKVSTPSASTPSSIKPKPDEIAAAASKSGKTTKTPRWWTPGAGWGLTMDVVDRLEGVEGLYNAIVPELVKGGHLPKAATTARGGATTPWAILQEMPVTGKLENNPGLDYRNWQMIIRELSEDNLLSRADDILDSQLNGRGIVWIFRHPDSPIRMEKALTVTLTAETLRSSYDKQTAYELQYGHMNTETTTLKDAKVSARESGFSAGAGGGAGGVSMQGTVNAQYVSRESENVGRTQSSSVLSDTDGQKMKSRSFKAEIRWHWTVKPASNAPDKTKSGTIDAQAFILQPDKLNDTGDAKGLGRLVIEPGSGNVPPMTTENLSVEFMERVMKDPNAQSPITSIDATAYTVLGTFGAERLQSAMAQAIADERSRAFSDGVRGRFARVQEKLEPDPEVRAQQLEAFLSNALSRQAYKGFLLRALTGASVAIPVGGGAAGLTAALVGTPEIVKVWKPYSQQVTEAQAGKESGADNLWQAGGGAGGFIGKSGLKPVIEDAPSSDAGNSELVIGTGAAARVKGRGKAAVKSNTVGKYSGLFQDASAVIVRSAVVHRIQVGKTVKWVAGEVLLNVKTTDVIPYARLFKNAELIADEIAAAKSTAPPGATLTSAVRSSTGQQHSSHGATVWQMLLSGGNEQTGVAPLVKALAKAAEPFESAGLANYVTSVPAIVNPFMGKALDGGMSQPYVDDDQRTFQITLRAEQVGQASGSHDSGSGTKSYTRGNDALNETRRWTSANAVVGSSGGLGQPFHPEEGDTKSGFDLGFVAASVVGGFTRATGRSDTHGSNLLTMAGARVNNLTGYSQNVRFSGTIKETTPGTTAALKKIVGAGRKDQPFEVTVKLLVSEPTGGSTTLGADRPRPAFGLSRTLPETAQVLSIRGLGAIHEAISSAGLARSGTLNDTRYQLNYETFPKKLRAMLTDEGARFRSLSTATADLDAGSRGFIVKARVAEVEDLYWVAKAEIEKYDHGTDLVGHGASETLRSNMVGAITVAGAPDLVNWVGGTGSVGTQRGTTRGTDQTRWNEHRAWLRTSTALFVVHARLQYEVTWPGKRGVQKIPAIGYTDIVVSKADARALGIPDEALAAVVPAESRTKEFPDYVAGSAARPDKPSAVSSSTADRFHRLLRQADAGMHALRPPAGASRVDISNMPLVSEGAHADPKGKRPASVQPVVWYELVRSDKELTFVLRVHLTGDPKAVSKVKKLTTEGVQSHLNEPGHQLPMADRQLRVEVQFVDAGQAHLVRPVVSPTADVDEGWAWGQSPAFYAHKVLRSIGAADHQPPSRKEPVDARLEVRPADLQQIMDVLEPMWPWRDFPGGALHGLPAGDGGLSPAPEWLRTSLARIERPSADIPPNLLSDSWVAGVGASPPPKALRATAGLDSNSNQYFVWLGTARDGAVDRPVFEWLNERLEQLAQAGKTPIVVTSGRGDAGVSGSARSVGKLSLTKLLSTYGVALVYQVPQSSGGLSGASFDNSWKVRGATSAAVTAERADATWSKIDSTLVTAARDLTQPTVERVPDDFGALVWGAQGVRERFDLLRSRPDLANATHLEHAARMAERVPASMNVALVKPLLSFGPHEEVVVQFTEAAPEARPRALLQAVARLDKAGKLKGPQDSAGGTGGFVDLVQAVRLGANEAEHKQFDFTVSLLRTIGQIKAGKFDDATDFITANSGKLEPGQKTLWVDALAELKGSIADATERGRLQKVLEAVYEC
ncbi:hypothetical protein ABZS77_23605 [Micromonospora sp. NPDC005298]|uniref:hypothetical protein n=1 Tax=Micromonospora sp. NPDC005298 TaxID=3156873 RepID=UPI0033AFFA48